MGEARRRQGECRESGGVPPKPQLSQQPECIQAVSGQFE